jgi:superfamily II DNA or RNA helicase
MTAASYESAHLPGSWAWSDSYRQPVKIVEQGSVWGETYLTVFCPGGNLVDRIAPQDLSNLSARHWNETELRARALTLAAIDALNKPVSTAVSTSNVDPLPHQLLIVERALETSEPRLLLADEVGLGKTIEAGLILKELKNRGVVRRCVVVAPKSMQIQWVSEMQNRFNEKFARFGAGGIPFDAGIDPWNAFDQVVCSIDSVKPIGERKGWTKERVDLHNQHRFDALVEADWDLVVIDEAHHVAGSEEDVARHELAVALCKSTRRVLLLSATPHSGKSEAFARLMSLLDTDFAHGKPINPVTVRPLVARTEKRNAKSIDGSPLFQPRTTSLERVEYGSRTVERQLYDSVTDYVRHRYKAAMLEKNNAAGFLTLLMQRLVSSSTAAILKALEKRKLALTEIGDQLELFPGGAEDWGDLSAEEQVDAFVTASEQAWGNELREVELLVDLAKKAVLGLDSKAEHLLSLIQRVRRDTGIPSLKVLVFTEFRETQNMLITTLNSAGISTAKIDGGMTINSRESAQREFEYEKDVLVSTDAGGEGINLQFASVVVNYDMPWNPMRVEQRIGRVDRIGQKHPVKAFNLVNEHSIDDRVLQILEIKLATILADVGIDKRSDVLETSSHNVENLFTSTLLEPDRIEEFAQQLAEDVAETTKQGISVDELLGSNESSDGTRFVSTSAITDAIAAWATWSGDAVGDMHGLMGQLPVVALGESVPALSGSEPGTLSIWEITNGDSHQIFSIFKTDTGQIRPDLGRLYLDKSGTFTGTVPTAELTKNQWQDIFESGSKYAPRPDLSNESINVPSLDLRLVVRVEHDAN